MLGYLFPLYLYLAFGKTLSGMQQVRHTMAEIKTDIVLSRVLTDKLIEAYANDDMDQQTVSMAKVRKWAYQALSANSLLERLVSC